MLKEADAGMPVNEIWRKHAISSATYYKWKTKYGGLDMAELKRVKELEAESVKLKRMYADLALENQAIKAVLNRKLKRRPSAGKRCGFDRLWLLGHGWNHKLVYRVYCGMKLNLLRRTKRLRSPEQISQPLAPHDRTGAKQMLKRF